MNTSTEYLVSTSSIYHLPDALGSVRQLTDASGQVTLANTYEPYGNLAQTAGSAQTSYGFTGEWTDPSGLVYLRARYYQPDTGRFFQQDPWDGDPNLSSTLNPYTYALNNPLLYTDPSGAIPQLLAAMGLGFAAGVVLGTAVGFADRAWALSGECGCDIQQTALSMETWQWVGTHALVGGIIGGISPLIALAAASAPIGAIVIGGAGVVFGGIDLYNTINIIRNETGLTWCTGIRAALDITSIIFGGALAWEGIQAWRASGSALQWVKPTTAIVPYDPQFAARQLLTSGQKISVSRMRAMIPDDVPSTFVPAPNIMAGYKYQFKINDTWVELKWHSPDTNVAHIPNSNSGHNWTAQITVGGVPQNNGLFSKLDGGLLLGSNGMFYGRQQGNLTHILLAP